MLDARRIRAQIAGVARKFARPGAKHQGQAAGRNLEVHALACQALAQIGLATREEARFGEGAREEGLQAPMAGDEAAPGDIDHLVEARGEHDFIAQALLARDEQRAPRESAAAPARIIEALVERLYRGHLEPRLVLFPARLPLAPEQAHHGFAEFAGSAVAAPRRFAMRGDRFFVAALVLECHAERNVSLGQARARAATPRGSARSPPPDGPA